MGAEIAVVVNPVAGHGRTRRLWPAVARAMQEAGLTFDASFTSGPGDACTLAAEAARAGYSLVVAVGGDGTLNEVVNGLLASDAPRSSDVRLGVVSCGTGCDLIRTLGIPRGVAGVSALAGGESRPIDVGQVTYRAPDGTPGRRCFVNAGDLGLGAEVARRVNRGSKRLGGFLSFFVGGAVSIVKVRFQPVEYVVDDEPPVADVAGLVFVANGRYAAGGMLFAPQAELDDGLFDVVLLREVSRPELLFDLFPRVYRGAHLGHPRVVHRKAARLVVSSPEPLHLEVDGELPGGAPAEFTLLPRAIRVAVPAGQGRPDPERDAACEAV